MLHSIPAPAAAHFTKLEAYWAGVTGNNVSFNNGLNVTLIYDQRILIWAYTKVFGVF